MNTTRQSNTIEVTTVAGDLVIVASYFDLNGPDFYPVDLFTVEIRWGGESYGTFSGNTRYGLTKDISLHYGKNVLDVVNDALDDLVDAIAEADI